MAPTACGSAVSGSLSLPSRGPFHLSLTVLYAIGSRRVFSLGGWSPLFPPGFLVSRRTQAARPAPPHPLRVRGSHPLRPAFPDRSAVLAARTGMNPRRTPTTPRPRRPAVWAPPRSLAATGGISFDFFSCRYLDGSLPCVSPRGAYVFSTAARGLLRADYSIRAPGDLGMSAPPPGFSQLAAPFLAWRLPGILREPFLRLTISSFPSSRSTVKKPSTGGRGVRTPDPRLAKPMP
jgi:hypothetical protein